MIKISFIFFALNAFASTVSFCDAPAHSGLQDHDFVNNLGFQEPASPLMEGLIALHSDIWAIMLFVAGFVLYMIFNTLYRFYAGSTHTSYKVHHHSLIEIIWTTIPALILCVIAVPSFTLLYSLDEIVQPSLTISATSMALTMRYRHPKNSGMPRKWRAYGGHVTIGAKTRERGNVPNNGKRE